MEDKVFLDEAGLGEVGKVISKFYANKDDITDLDSLKDFVGSHNEIKLHYITNEEYQKMYDNGKTPSFSDIHDPISIVGLELIADSGACWSDEPVDSLYGMGLNVERVLNDSSQKYLLFNITPNHEITSDKIDNVDFSEIPLKDKDVRLQLAFGEKDQCFYWRFLINDDFNSEWHCIQDPCLRQWADNLIKQMQDKANKSELPTKLSQLEEDETHRTVTDKNKETWNNKVDKVDGKGLSTNDYSNEDKQKIEEYKIQQRIDKARAQFSSSPSTILAKMLSEFLISGTYYLPRPNITWSISCENNIITINSQPVKQERITEEQYNQAINYLSPTQYYMLYVEKIDEEYLVVQSNTQKCYIKQTLWDTTHGVQFCRLTKECKSEYSDSAMSSKIPLNTPSGSNHYFLSDEKWGDWFIPHDSRLYLQSVDDQNKVPGLMSPENKRKLDSINIEEIKSLIQRVEALESKMH